MKKRRKTTSIYLGTLLALLAILTVPVVLLFTAPMIYSGLVERTIHATTGLEVRFDELAVNLFPRRITTGHLKVFNPSTAYDKPILALDHLSLTVDASRFFGETPDWWSAQASGVVLRSGQDDSGQSLWRRPADKTDGSDLQQQDDSQSPLFSFDSIQIADLDYFRVSGDNAPPLHVSQLSLTHESNERLRLDLDASYQDQPLTASGTLALPSPEHAQKVNLRASMFGSDLHLEATLGPHGNTVGDARISANAQDLSTLGRLVGKDLSGFAPVVLKVDAQAPKSGSWTISARGEVGGDRIDLHTTAKTTGKAWELDDLTAQLGDAHLSADSVLNLSDKKVKATVSARHLDLDQLPFTGNDSGVKSGDNRGPLSVSYKPAKLDLLKQWTIDADLTVTELLYQDYRVKGLKLDANTSADKLIIKASTDGITARRDGTIAWQLSKPLHIDGTLSLPTEGKSGAGWLSVQYRSKGLTGEVEATLPAKAREPLQITLQTGLDNFSALRGVDTQKWNALLPLEVSMQARTAGKKVEIDPVKISVNGNDIDGQLQIDRSKAPLRISGDLHAGTFDINRISTTSAANPGAAKKNSDKNSGKVFDNRPIDWSWIEAASVDLGIHLDELSFNQTNFHNVRIKIGLRDDQLRIDPIAADLAKGGVRGHVDIREEGPGADIDTRLIVTELVPADLGQPDKGIIDGGETDLFIDLHTSGATPHELAAALSGELALEIQRATIRNDVFERIGSDILMQTLNLVNPFAKHDDRTELECAAANFDVVDGIMTSPDQIAIETSKMKIRGGGDINLGKETLQIDLVPSARRGLGIGAGDLARLVRLGGTLRHPHPVADPQGILKSGATIGAAIATGGVSLLAEGLFNKARNAGSRCGKIFEQSAEIPEAIRRSDPAKGTEN